MPSILFGPYAGAAGLALKLQAAVLLQAGAPGAYAPEMAPVVDPSSTAIVSRFDSGFIEAMPILGHDYQDILTLAPGVDDPDGDGAPNVRGARDTDLQTRFDGGDTTDPVTGLAGQNLSPLAVERIDAITAGAPARYGRAMGGFADVTTRSGGNGFTGRLALYWSGRFLDGDGANRNDIDRFQGDLPAFHDARGAVSVGGPIVRDRAWYFASFERLDREESVSPYEGTGEISSRGTYYMGKLSWQSGETHRTSFQIIGDPRRVDGLGVSPTTDLASGFSLDQGGLSAQLSWAASVSDSVRFEAAITHLHTEFEVEPSSRFHERIPVVLDLTGSLGDPHALIYPCGQNNCSETLGERRFYRIDGFTGRARGPYPFENDDERRRDALRADVTIDVEGAAGSHRLAGGFELGREELRRLSHLNPILVDSVTVFGGSQTFFVYRPAFEDRRVADQATGLYISDSWKPAPNLLITAGLRFDKEEIDAPGFVPFDPLVERRRSVALWRAVCEEAVIQGIVPVNSNCSPLRPYDGLPPTDIPSFQSFRDQDMDGTNDIDPRVASLDLNRDGTIQFIGAEGEAFFRHFTRYAALEPVRFEIDNAHVSPRVGISWDPWSDGRTRFFAHWGRYHDRLRFETALADSEPTALAFTFATNAQRMPGARSASSADPSVLQLDHNLSTPRTDELSLGVEGALGDSWSIGLAFIRRQARGLLQDADLNHFTCLDAKEAIGIDPAALCPDINGVPDPDRIGAVPGGFPFPNGVEDLYTASALFNQVLRVENSNDSDYSAWELTLVRAQHANWQMKAGYTLSRARGQAATELSIVADDPSTAGAEYGYLDYDQRHRVKVQAVASLPRRLVLSGAVRWESGAPYSVFEIVSGDFDSSGNSLTRILYPTGRRNDQRNESAWKLDARVEKGFRIGRVTAAGFLLAENLLNDDTLQLRTVSESGEILNGRRDFGRRFEIGALFGF